MADQMTRLRWVTIENQIMTASTQVRDGDMLRLFVAARPEGKWDWRVWHTVRGHDYRFGVASTASDAVEAAALAARDLAEELTPLMMPAPSPPPPAYPRNVSDKVLAAFHLACDQSDLPVAKALLRILDTLAMQRPMPEDSRKKRTMEQLVAAHARRWHLINEHQK
jgi:hypothetical protein